MRGIKNGYFSLWYDTIAGVLTKMNDLNGDLHTPGTRYELIQILPQPQAGDTPGQPNSTEGWIGIVRMTTPPQALPAMPYDPDEPLI